MLMRVIVRDMLGSKTGLEQDGVSEAEGEDRTMLHALPLITPD